MCLCREESRQLSASRLDIVRGYHGTTPERAQRILSAGFEVSRNTHDWLGHGVYFFERGMDRAAEFARKWRRLDEPSVLEAEIALRDCLDLTDTQGRERLRPYYDMYVEKYGRAHVAALDQTEGGLRGFDCAVINYACDILEERGEKIAVIRQAFPEGPPVWEDPEGELPPSGLLEQTHVQLVVRDAGVIGDIRLTAEYQGAR